MLWYKCWLETRWRFLIGLLVLPLLTAAIVLNYPAVIKFVAMMPKMEGRLGTAFAEAMGRMREFHSYVWSQLFDKNLMQVWTIFAVLLGTGGLFTEISSGAALFTLSLPASRRRLLAVRAALALAELAVLALAPALLVTALAPAVQQHYALGDALVQALCLFAGGSVFFGLAFLLSSIFGDLWRPLLISIGVALVLAICWTVIRPLAPYSVYRVMSAETWFRHGALPWLGLLASVAASAALLGGAARITARRDF